MAHIVAFLDGLSPIGDLRQAKVKALREVDLTPGPSPNLP